MDFFKELLEKIKGAWAKWSTVQKVIFGAIIAAVIVGIFLLASFSSAPSEEALFSRPITDELQLSSISLRLDQENVKHRESNGIIYVDDKMTATRMKAILIREDLIPSGTTPWDVFDQSSWTTTELQQDVALQRALTSSMEDMIESLDEVDSASVRLVFPKDELFASEQNPVTASVVLSPQPNSNLAQSRSKIEGIVKLIQLGVEGLYPENIVITDSSGTQINNFEDLAALDQLDVTSRMLKEKQVLEARYMSQIIEPMQRVFTEERIEIINLDIDLEYVDKTVHATEYSPIIMKPDNPLTSYDDSEIVESIATATTSTVEEYNGTGFNPNGPPGQAGQTPPQYDDLNNLVGNYHKDSTLTEFAVNKAEIDENKSPYEIQRISVSVAIDGVWEKERDENGEFVFENGSIKRTYIPVDPEILATAKSLVEGAIGYAPARFDLVAVEHIPFDHTEEFALEDAEYLRKQQTQRILFYLIIGVAILIVGFIVFRLIAKEMERRKRQREEELARQHQAMREQALRNAEEEGIETEMSVQERARLEMQENAMNLAREHPEDVAKLIKTWLSEE